MRWTAVANDEQTLQSSRRRSLRWAENKRRINDVEVFNDVCGVRQEPVCEEAAKLTSTSLSFATPRCLRPNCSLLRAPVNCISFFSKLTTRAQKLVSLPLSSFPSPKVNFCLLFICSPKSIWKEQRIHPTLIQCRNSLSLFYFSLMFCRSLSDTRAFPC